MAARQIEDVKSSVRCAEVLKFECLIKNWRRWTHFSFLELAQRVIEV